MARQRPLLRAAFVLTGDRQLAEDLVQTVLARAWLRWARIDAVQYRDAYLNKMLFTEFLRWRRKWGAGETPLAALPEAAEAQLVPDVDLARALQRLPRRQRAVVVLHYLQDLSEREAADILGCSVGTIKSQKHKALASLRLALTGTSPDRDAQHEQAGGR